MLASGTLKRAPGTVVMPPRRLALGAGLGLGLLFAGAAAALPFEARDGGWEGLQSLVKIAEDELHDVSRVVTTSTLDWSALTPADGLLLIHPERTVDAD